MSIDSARDWEGLREAGRVTRMTLDALERHARVGVSTAELDEVAADVFKEHGARSAPAIVYGFPRTVLISINDEIVHGVPGRRRLQRGDLVKIDVTVEKDGYVADAARSLVIEGGSDTAHRLAACAAAALDAALEVARAGLRVNGIGRAVDTGSPHAGFRGREGIDGTWRGSDDSRMADRCQPLHAVADRRAHRRARADDRADDQRRIFPARAGRQRLDDSDERWQPRGAPRAHPRDHAGAAGDPDGGLTPMPAREATCGPLALPTTVCRPVEPRRRDAAPAPGYVGALDDRRRSALRERLEATLPVAADGSISLTTRAWAVRGRRISR
jgi:hypothetical protein